MDVNMGKIVNHYETCTRQSVCSKPGNLSKPLKEEHKLVAPYKDGSGWVGGEPNCPECILLVFGGAPYLVAVDTFEREYACNK